MAPWLIPPVNSLLCSAKRVVVIGFQVHHCLTHFGLCLGTPMGVSSQCWRAPGTSLRWLGALILCWSVGLTSPAVMARPAEVLLMRHGHKTDNRANTNLSMAGFQRALALATALPTCFGQIHHILTFVLNPSSGKNARSYQSAVPLAISTGTTIRILERSEGQSEELGRQILRNPTYGNSRIVVFWEHRHLPELAAGLGWSSMPPIDNDDFDRLYQLIYSTSDQPTVRAFDQRRLLDGSQPCFASASTSITPQR